MEQISTEITICNFLRFRKWSCLRSFEKKKKTNCKLEKVVEK